MQSTHPLTPLKDATTSARPVRSPTIDVTFHRHDIESQQKMDFLCKLRIKFAAANTPRSFMVSTRKQQGLTVGKAQTQAPADVAPQQTSYIVAFISSLSGEAIRGRTPPHILYF
jgi:hypothetical protein